MIWHSEHVFYKPELIQLGTELDHYISFVDERLKDSFVPTIFEELEKGERVIKLGSPRNYDELHSVRRQMSIKIDELVRCGECIHRYDPLVCPFIIRELAVGFISDPGLIESHRVEMLNGDDDFCSKGDRKDQNAEKREDDSNIN